MKTASSYQHSKPCVLRRKKTFTRSPVYPSALAILKQERMPWNLAVAVLPKPTNLVMKLMTFYLLHLTNYHGEIPFKSSWRWNCLTQLTACFDIIHLQVLHRCCFLWCKLSAAKPYKFSEFPSSENIETPSGGTMDSEGFHDGQNGNSWNLGIADTCRNLKSQT